MGTDAIRRIIAAATRQERQQGALQSSFQARVPSLAQQLQLPDSAPAEVLVEFVVRYIDYVPDFIETVSRRGKELGLSDSVDPFLHMAEDFFLAPPEYLEQDATLEALMDEAFLAQRLIEELNDRHIRLRRTQLVPVDMTRANIIVHHLIGDELANRLDQLVEQSVTRLIDTEQLFRRFDADIESGASMLSLWQGLPCLSRDLAIDLRL